MDKKMLVELTSQIVSSHVSNTSLTTEQLGVEIQSVFGILSNLATGESTVVESEPEVPKISVKKAFGKDQIFCMICGKGFTTLKKHLSVSHQLTPRDYRKKFGIPASMSLASKNFSEQKRETAKRLGLGEKLAAGRANKAAKKSSATKV